MAAFWLAIQRSLQNGNAVKNPAPGGPHNEMAQMTLLVDCYVAELQTTFRNSGIIWKVIPGRPYSEGTDLSTLYEQVREGRAFLDRSPQGTPSIALNVHSDAPGPNTPGTSHVGARVDSRGTHALGLTRAICKAIAPVFGCQYNERWFFDGTGYVYAKELADTPHIALLIEHGDHTVYQDNVTLHTKGRLIARASLAAQLRYYGHPVPDLGGDEPMTAEEKAKIDEQTKMAMAILDGGLLPLCDEYRRALGTTDLEEDFRRLHGRLWEPVAKLRQLAGLE